LFGTFNTEYSTMKSNQEHYLWAALNLKPTEIYL